MEDFIRSCVEGYKELTGETCFRPVSTPFLSEHMALERESAASAQEVERFLHHAADLQPDAATALLKILYVAQYVRFDLLRSMCYLARYISKWGQSQDRRLCRLVCYINSSLHVRMTGWVGDAPCDIGLHLFAGADFAGDSKTS